MNELEIQAGPHERVHCPVAVPAIAAGVAGLPFAGTGQGTPLRQAADGKPAEAGGGAVLRVAGGEQEVPLQQDGDGLWCVLPYLAAGGRVQMEYAPCSAPAATAAARVGGAGSGERVEIGPGNAPAPTAAAQVPGVGGAEQESVVARGGRESGAATGVRIADRGTHLEVSVAGVRWCDYHYAGHPVRSYLHPVIGPYGVPMTRAWPLADGVPDEEHDHPHHRSFWVAHGRVNGVDFWSEERGHGYQVHGGFEAVRSGPVFGRIAQRVSWRRDAPDGAPVLEERRSLTFWNTPDTARILDLTVALHAAHGDVTFGDTKEGGLCALRVPEAIKGARGGMIRNAYGGIHEAENWGQRAPWVDYAGDLNAPDGTRRTVGVAIFDHPRNPHYPTHWHVRGYGLFAANPFGLRDYGSGYRKNGDWTLAAGAQATFRYRVLWHDGDALAAQVGARFLDWAAPPLVTVAD